MKRLTVFAKCILAALPAILFIAYTLLCPFCYMDEEYPAWRFEKEVVSGKEYDGRSFDTVVIGDSGAMSSIIPSVLGDSVINLAVGGATSIEMYYFLTGYLEEHDAPDTLIIMFAPFHYWHIDNYKTRTVYFKAIDTADLYELYKNAAACGAESVLYDGVITDEISSRLGLPNIYLPAINAAGFAGRRAGNKKAYEDLKETFGYAGFGKLDECYDMSYETSYEDMEINGDAKLITLYMQKILRLCNEKGIKVRLLQPAVNEATFDNLNKHYYSSYRNYIKQLSGICDKIEFENDLRVYDGRYFSDTSHLNEEGALRFSGEISESGDNKEVENAEHQ